MVEMINRHRRLGGSSFCALRSLPMRVPGSFLVPRSWRSGYRGHFNESLPFHRAGLELVEIGTMSSR